MALTVNTNTASLNVQRSYANNQQSLKQVLAQLASGSSINSAADNPAGLAIAEALTSQLNGYGQALNNTNDGISLTQTAAGALRQIAENTQTIQGLAVEAANGTLTNDQRQALQQQVDQLTQENSRIVNDTQFNGIQLLSGNQPLTVQAGPDGTANDQISVNSAGLNNTPANGGLNSYNANLNASNTINISTQANALNAINLTGQDLNTLGKVQANYGAVENRFTTAINNLTTANINTADARSRISDTDFAAATATLTQNQILSSANIATLIQANISQSTALTLLR